MKKLVLVGGGGHCKSVIDVIEQQGVYEIAGIVDVPEVKGKKVLNYEIFADDDMLPQLVKKYSNFAITCGHLTSNETRVSLYKTLVHLGAEFPTLISPHAYISKHSMAGEGTVIFHGAIVNVNSSIGINGIINTDAVVEHDASIKDHTHISTGAIINGNCRIGSNCFVGSRAVVIQGTKVGDDIVIGANATVVQDLQEPGIYAGTPARKI